MAAAWKALEDLGLKEKVRSKKLHLDMRDRRIVYLEPSKLHEWMDMM